MVFTGSKYHKIKLFGEFIRLGRAVTNGLLCSVRSVLPNTTHNLGDYLNAPVNADLKLHYDRYWSRFMKPYRRVELSTLPDQREISDIIKEFKKSVVCFDAWGFPDFLSFTKNVGNISCKVLIDVTGDFNTDAKRANAELKAKLTGTPFANISTFNGQNNIFGDKITYTWHHDQDSQHMLLVPTMLNTNNKPNLEHLGGSAIIKKGLKNSFPSSVKLNCN